MNTQASSLQDLVSSLNFIIGGAAGEAKAKQRLAMQTQEDEDHSQKRSVTKPIALARHQKLKGKKQKKSEAESLVPFDEEGGRSKTGTTNGY